MQENLKPLSDRVVIKQLEQAGKTAGGIFLPETAKDDSQEGIVVEVGPGRMNDDGKILPMTVEVGHHVVYTKYGGSKIKRIDGTEAFIVAEKDVLAIVGGSKVAAGV